MAIVGTSGGSAFLLASLLEHHGAMAIASPVVNKRQVPLGLRVARPSSRRETVVEPAPVRG